MNREPASSEVMSYSAALARLKAIVMEIESSEIDVDKLEETVKEAVGLIEFCRAKLHGTQSAVETALVSLTQEASEVAAAPTPQGAGNAAASNSPAEDDPFSDD